MIALYTGSAEDWYYCSMCMTGCTISHSQAYYCRGTGLIPGRTMWDLW